LPSFGLLPPGLGRVSRCETRLFTALWNRECARASRLRCLLHRKRESRHRVTIHNHIDDNEENTDNKLERQTRVVPNE